MKLFLCVLFVSVASVVSAQTPLPAQPNTLTFSTFATQDQASAIINVTLPDPPLNWEILGTADVDHDGINDIVWIDRSTQQVVVWFMSAYWFGIIPRATAIIEGINLHTPPSGYVWEMLRLAPAGVEQLIFRLRHN